MLPARHKRQKRQKHKDALQPWRWQQRSTRAPLHGDDSHCSKIEHTSHMAETAAQQRWQWPSSRSPVPGFDDVERKGPGNRYREPPGDDGARHEKSERRENKSHITEVIQPAPQSTDLLQPPSQPTIEQISCGDQPKQANRAHARPRRRGGLSLHTEPHEGSSADGPQERHQVRVRPQAAPVQRGRHAFKSFGMNLAFSLTVSTPIEYKQGESEILFAQAAHAMNS
jgi:hypothetical protein